MMNYLAKHSVIEITLPTSAHSSMSDIKILTAIELSYDEEELIDITQFGIDMKISEVLYLQSYTGGGVTFPSINTVYRITMQDYANEIARYMQNIKEKHLILIDTKGRHTIAILEALAKVAKRVEKHVHVIAIKPFDFIGKNHRLMFHNEWENLKQISDEQTLYDGMKMLEQLDKKMNMFDTNTEIVKIIFHDLYNEMICQKTTKQEDSLF